MRKEVSLYRQYGGLCSPVNSSRVSVSARHPMGADGVGVLFELIQAPFTDPIRTALEFETIKWTDGRTNKFRYNPARNNRERKYCGIVNRNAARIATTLSHGQPRNRCSIPAKIRKWFPLLITSRLAPGSKQWVQGALSLGIKRL
jgi:hypothetical protein